MGIILEDDCLLNNSFFTFCEELLIKYKENEQIFVITGDNFQNGKIIGEGSYYFSKYNHVWGWATWKRAWLKFDLNISFWTKWKHSNDWKLFLPDRTERRYWEKIFEDMYFNKIDTWDYAWTACVWYNNGITITPNYNLVSNIGFGEDATHTTSTNKKFSKLETHSINNIIFVNDIIIDMKADQYVFNEVFGGKRLRFPYILLTFIKKLVFKILNLVKNEL